MSNIFLTVDIKQQRAPSTFLRPEAPDNSSSTICTIYRETARSLLAISVADLLSKFKLKHRINRLVIVITDWKPYSLPNSISLQVVFIGEIFKKSAAERRKSLIFQNGSRVELSQQRSRKPRIHRGSVDAACRNFNEIVVRIRSYCVCGQCLFTVELTDAKRFSLAFDLAALNFYRVIGYVSAAFSTLIILEVAFCETHISPSKFSFTKIFASLDFFSEKQLNFPGRIQVIVPVCSTRRASACNVYASMFFAGFETRSRCRSDIPRSRPWLS